MKLTGGVKKKGQAVEIVVNDWGNGLFSKKKAEGI